MPCEVFFTRTKYGSEAQPAVLDKFLYDPNADMIVFGGPTAFNFGYHHSDLYDWTNREIGGEDYEVGYDCVAGYLNTVLNKFQTYPTPEEMSGGMYDELLKKIHEHFPGAEYDPDTIRGAKLDTEGYSSQIERRDQNYSLDSGSEYIHKLPNPRYSS